MHDYRVIDSRTKKQSYSLPRISDLTQQIRGATIFSSLDLKNAFWQLDVRPSDRQYTAFSTSRGNFEYNKLPQGLTYASNSFQKFTNLLMRGTESFCFCYVDDIIIFSKDQLEHKRHLHNIANRLNHFLLKLNMDKCLLGVSELTALGYNLSAHGIAASKDKIMAIEKLPEPTTIKELRQALGLINYQRRFIPRAAGILAPLAAYLKGHVNLSGTAMGEILEQQIDDNTEVLGYFSKTLTDTQRKYSTYDLELLAMHAAVKYFEYMLLDKTFTIYTDDQSLVRSFLKPSEKHTARQVRQLTYLSQFDCTVQHVPGSQNQVADCLSRYVQPHTVNHIFQAQEMPCTLEKIATGQQQYVNTDVFEFPAASFVTIQNTHVPGCNHSILVDTSQSTPRILLPPHLEKQVIEYYHNLHHFDIKATRRCIQTRFLFKNMNTKIRNFVRSCVNCQCAKTTRHVVSPVSSIPMPNCRFQRISIDIAGPFPSSRCQSYILVCVDPFTRFVETFPMPDQTTESVIQSLNLHLQYFGAALEIHSDAGCQFTSHTFQDYCNFIGSNHRISSVRYPQSNGIAERAIKSIKIALTAQLDSAKWVYHLPTIILCLNTMIKEDLKASAAGLVFGQSLRLPGDIFFFKSSIHPSVTSNYCQEHEKLCLRFKTHSHVQQHATHVQQLVFNNMLQCTCPTYRKRAHTSSSERIALNPICHLLILDPISLCPEMRVFTVLKGNRIVKVAINNVKPGFTLAELNLAPSTEQSFPPSSPSDPDHTSATLSTSSPPDDLPPTPPQLRPRRRIFLPFKLHDFDLTSLHKFICSIILWLYS